MTTSILILTHDAPGYVEETLVTLNEITDSNDLAECEIIVIDNASQEPVKNLLHRLKDKGYIDKLHFSERNMFFAAGNNMAAAMADPNSKYVLLLNSDIRIKDPSWLSKMYELKKNGDFSAVGYGFCNHPKRVDGYCLLVDRKVFLKYGLDEDFPWWGGVTKLQYEILRDGGRVLAVDNHDNVVYHYGGRSGKDYKKAGRNDQRYDRLIGDFKNMEAAVDVIDMEGGVTLSGTLRKKCKKLAGRIKRFRL